MRRHFHIPIAVAVALATAALAVAGGGTASASSPRHSSVARAATRSFSSSAASPFGTPHRATGKPYLFGLINDETGAVTFPESRQAEIAAADYVNEYLDGINGHPIKLADCIGDGTAPTSARCASELTAKHPLAILGAADTGTPGSEPVYEHADLAYIGGLPLTPVEQNAPNSIQFWAISLGDNAAASVFAAHTLHAKSAVVLYPNNSEGKLAGLGIIPQVMKAAGITTIKTIGIPPTTPDPSPEVAETIAAHPDVVYVDMPNNCGVVLKDLKSLGYSGKLEGIDPCTSPQAISSAAGAATGMYIASAFNTTSPEFKVFLAALKRWGAPNTAIDGVSESGFATVMNVRYALDKIKGTPTTKTILAALKSNHTNFMSHPYSCNGTAMAKAVSICNSYFLMEQIRGSSVVEPNPNDWITGKNYFKGL